MRTTSTFPQYRMGMNVPSKGVLQLIIFCIVVYITQQLVDAQTQGGFSRVLALSWDGIGRGHVWQFVSYVFLHASPSHLLLNMLMLFLIGPETERGLGKKHFYIMFLFSGLVGGLCWLLLNLSGYVSLVGASAGIYGVLFAFAALYPNRRLMLIFFPFVTFKAWVLVLCFAVLELIFLVSREGGMIAYAAHLGGGLAGCFYALIGFRKGLVSWVWHRTKSRYTQRKEAAYSPAAVDTILDKVAREGIHSLTKKERTVLDQASRNR